MPGFSVSRKAQADIRDIGRYTQERWGGEQRRLYLTGLETRFKSLSDNPLLSAQRREFDPPVRIHRYERHLIVYTETNGDILIIRVLHVSMNVPVQLTDE